MRRDQQVSTEDEIVTAERGALIGVAFAIGMLAAFWIVSDDRIRRPATVQSRSAPTEDVPFLQPPRTDTLTARFTFCDGPIRTTCVVDGDTFWFKGNKIRIADIDAPEIFSPHCEEEKYVGEVARNRLLELMNAGGFSLQSGWRDTDRYGRNLRTVTRNSRSLGEIIVEEGLAQRWGEPRRDWCNG